MTILQVKLTPRTWIKAPIATKEQVRRYIAKGWISKEVESLDRAFPRTESGKPFIPKIWLEAAMVKAAKQLGVDSKFAREGWHIVKKVGDKWLDIDYIELEEQPLIYSRTIGGVKPSMEVFEYIDGTFTVTFHVEVEEVNLQKFMQVLALAGELGMMSMTRKGFGKFKCEVGILPEEAEHEQLKKRRLENRAEVKTESKKV